MNPLSPKTIGVFASSLLFVAAAILGLDAPASAEPPDKTTAKSKAPPPVKAQQEEAQKPQFAPLVEAQKNGVKTCLPMLGELARFSISGPHTSVSSWSRETPDERMFSAMSLSTQTNAGGSNSLSLISATPTVKGHCDGSDVRIEASKQSCDEIARDMQKQNVAKPETVNGTLLYPPNAAGQRLVLLPSPASGCVVVTTGGYYGR
ncbi:MAG: hypothetical protein WBS22_11810 [Methylocystis sp.]